MKTPSEFRLTDDLIEDRTRRFLEDLRAHGHRPLDGNRCPHCRVANYIYALLKRRGDSI